MRTDSVNLSQEAINSSKDFIKKEFGKHIFPRNYTTKSASAQELERSHSTNRFFWSKAIGHVQLNKLYQLIYKRTLASQMANAKIEKTVIQNRKFSGIAKSF